MPSPRQSKPTHPPRATPPSEPPRTDAARDAACAAIADLASSFPDMPIRPPATEHLEPLDAAFAHAIHDAVLRRWLTLRCVVGSRLRQPFESLDVPVRAVLLVGSAQMLLLDKVPVHAAVDTSVEWAKAHAPKAASLVNAVLRGVARLIRDRVPAWTNRQNEIPLSSGGAIRLAEPVLPHDLRDRIASAASVRSAMVHRWAAHYGLEQALAIAHHGLVNAPTLLNVAFEPGIDEPLLAPHQAPGTRVFTGPRHALADLLAHHPRIFVQDAAASHAVERVRDLNPALIVDACAGQGTKTRQLSLQFPDSRILATDVDDDRLRALRASAGPNVEVVRPEELDRLCAGRADLVLLDVPCSNSGVLARRLEARYRFDKAQLDRLVPIQQDILALGHRWTAPQGCLLYSTCSLEPEENAHQAAWMTRHAWRIEGECVTLPAGLPGEPASNYRDGAYSVRLRRG